MLLMEHALAGTLLMEQAQDGTLSMEHAQDGTLFMEHAQIGACSKEHLQSGICLMEHALQVGHEPADPLLTVGLCGTSKKAEMISSIICYNNCNQ